MSFFQFMFSFLYIRNWHTGKYELSRSRVALFGMALFLLLLAALLAMVLQAPVVYVATPSGV
jgi:hypothetical protein